VTLKEAFLQPMAAQLATSLATDLFTKNDADFMGMFVGALPNTSMVFPQIVARLTTCCHCMQCKDIQHSRGHEVLNRMRNIA